MYVKLGIIYPVKQYILISLFTYIANVSKFISHTPLIHIALMKQWLCGTGQEDHKPIDKATHSEILNENEIMKQQKDRTKRTLTNNLEFIQGAPPR